MTIQSAENLWLKVRKGVTLTNIIDPVIAALDTWFGAVQHPAWVSSGKRDENDQLRIIKNLALENQLGTEYDFIASMTLDSVREWGGQRVPEWAIVWSKLLNIGVIVNPPRRQKTLMDYNRIDESTGKLTLYKPPGYEIGASGHFTGQDFDIAGAENGISDEVSIVEAAMKSSTIPGLKSYVLERKNNCVHCHCEAT